MRTSSSTIAYCYGACWTNQYIIVYKDVISVVSQYDFYTSFRVTKLVRI